jgi:CheY-like chemotaxis protein
MTTVAGTKILLVEDDRLLRDAFRLLLEDAGYDVVEAGTGGDALALARTEQPALMLLDLGLPDIHGLDVARELTGKPETQSIRIVALTGRTGAAEERACFEAGCRHYFAKPIEPRQLLRQLPDLLA